MELQDNSQILQDAIEHHQAGRFREAEALYQTILKQEPRHADALHLLGVMAHQLGRNDVAVQMIVEAIRINPNEPGYYNNCGEAYRALNQHDRAVALYEQALSRKPDYAGMHTNLGNILKDMGQLEDAINNYKVVIALNPDFALAHNNLGIAVKELGQLDHAADHYREAITVSPDFAMGHNNLGNLQLEQGRVEEAIIHYEQAIAVAPDFAEAHNNLGNALRLLGRYEDAIKCYKQAIALDARSAMTHNNLGITYDEMGRQKEAIGCYETAIQLEPGFPDAHNNLGNSQVQFGHSKKASTHFEKAIAARPDFAEAYRHLSMILPKQEHIPVLEKLLRKPGIKNADAMHCHFALGNIYHGRKMFTYAFTHYREANELKRQTVSYDASLHSKYVNSLIATYTKTYFETTAGFGSDSEVPVFIVGMPRSGTTLIEQIITSHPQVHGAGELPTLPGVEISIAGDIDNGMTYPDCMVECKAPVIESHSWEYLQKLKSLATGVMRITDKLPSNFLRIGLIKTLFPRARIIHCRRDPMDTCLSIFINYFVSTTGNEFSYSLEEIGQYYVDYERIMAHWCELFPNEIMTVDYENIIVEQEEVSRQLVEFVGLSWDKACLEFHRNDRAIRTTSSVQVRKPVYSTSINQWKAYEQHLSPLVLGLNSSLAN